MTLCLAGAASAQTLSASFPDVTTNYVQNAVTLGVNSSLLLDVRHTDTTSARFQVDVRLPQTTYAALGGSGPDSSWRVSTYTLGGYPYVRFTAPCTGAGLLGNTTARFTINLRTPTAVVGIDTRTSAFPVSVSVGRRNNGQCRTVTQLSTTTSAPQPWAKVLAVAPDTGTAMQQLAPPAVIRWKLSNYGNASKTGVTVTNLPAGSTCPAGLSLGAYANGPKTGTLLCTYPASPNSTFSLGGTNATGTPGPATAAGTAIGSIDVGNASVSWDRSTLVRGRPDEPIVLEVLNDSPATVSRVEVVAPSVGWTVSNGSSDSGTFGYVSSTTTAAIFGGSIAPRGKAKLSVYYSSLPGSGMVVGDFKVVLTPTSGSDFAVTFAQAVTVRPIPADVSLISVRSIGMRQIIEWTNPAGSQGGVVVLKATPPALPSRPVDLVDYTVPANRTSEFVYASKDPSVSFAYDDASGRFNYLVCHHDDGLVYSTCDTGDRVARPQFASNSAVAPAGGWTVQLGGEALGNLQSYAGGRAAIRTNRGDLNVINLKDGSRAMGANGQELAPTVLGYSLPASYTPGWRLANGVLVAVSADSDGWVTAINLETGDKYWRTREWNEVENKYESFTAGVSGATATSGLPAAYQGKDMIFLGSASTGRVLAIDVADGTTKWTVETHSSVAALIAYDSATSYLWVPTGAGVQAWSLKNSQPDADHPAELVWSQNYGPHSLYCVRTQVGALIACVDDAGILRVLNKLTGEKVGAEVPTLASSPSSLVRVNSGTPGFLVGSPDRLVRVVPTVASDATLTSLKVGSSWAPEGWTLSPALIFAAERYVIVGVSDDSPQGAHLYKRSSEDVNQALGSSPADLQLGSPGTRLGPVSYDATDGLYVFGTVEGRLWAIPSSSF